MAEPPAWQPGDDPLDLKFNYHKVTSTRGSCAVWGTFGMFSWPVLARITTAAPSTPRPWLLIHFECALH